MSGQTPPPAGPAAPAVASDQSMEDILASIRRILNEDEAPATPDASAAEQPEGAADAAASPGEPGPLLLTEDMMVSAPMPEPVPEPTPEPPPLPPEVVAEAPPAPAPDIDSLLAPDVAAAATASVGQLLRAVSSERGSTVTRGGPSIEDVVREELRPLLKSWLDQHLPAIVERLVRAEIERVTGRALG
jgi:cell pole-organizing protein PopZ